MECNALQMSQIQWNRKLMEKRKSIVRRVCSEINDSFSTSQRNNGAHHMWIRFYFGEKIFFVYFDVEHSAIHCVGQPSNVYVSCAEQSISIKIPSNKIFAFFLSLRGERERIEFIAQAKRMHSNIIVLNEAISVAQRIRSSSKLQYTIHMCVCVFVWIIMWTKQGRARSI